METNSPTDEPTPAPTPEIPAETPPAAEPPVDASVAADSGEPPVASSEPVAAEPADAVDSVAPEGGVPDELTQLAEASQRARLAPAEEERMGQLLKDALQGGRAGVARAVEALPKVPWIVGVRAVEAVWPDLTAGFRTQLVSGLAKDESDASRRIRLSLARAFFKIDMPTGLKVAAGVVRELRDTETGLITPKQAQIFANVFVGRGKPWLAQLSLAEMKPADGDALAHCAVLAVFTLPHPPVTQLGVLKWVAEQGRLGKLDASALEVMKKGLSRWSAKWQSALRKEVDGLPEEIIASLKPLPGTAPEAGEESATGSGEGAEGETAAAGEGAEGAEEDIDEEEDEDDDDEDEEEEDGEEEKSRKARPVYEPRPQKPQAERPVYTPRNSGGGAPKNFNINESLRNIDAYVQSLRNDLSAAQAKLRSRDDRRRPEKIGAIVEGEPTVEELARLNLQLEARNSELQDRIKELTQHAEDVAVSTGALTGQPVDDGALQLRTLLALKLQEDFADFHALESETNDQVVQQHYKTLLRHVFEVLQQLDVPLKA